MDVPVKDIPKDQMDKILYGSDGEEIHFVMKMNLGKFGKTILSLKVLFIILKDVISDTSFRLYSGTNGKIYGRTTLSNL